MSLTKLLSFSLEELELNEDSEFKLFCEKISYSECLYKTENNDIGYLRLDN